MTVAVLIGGPAYAQQDQTRGISQQEREFLTKAAEGSMAEVQMGKLAEMKGSSDEVKEIGQTLIEDHSQAYKKAQGLATEMQTALPSQPNEEQQSTIDRLADLEGQEFDREFLRHQAEAHEKSIQEFERAEQELQSAAVRRFASETLPVLREHQQLVQKAMGSQQQGGQTAEDRMTRQVGGALRVEANLPRVIPVGAETSMRVKVENTSDQPVQQVMVGQKLPEDFELASSKVGNETVEPESRSEGEYRWSLGELQANQSKTLEVTGKPAGRQDLQTCYSVSYEPTVCQTIAVASPKLQVETALKAEQRKTQDAFYACDELALQYRIRNSGKVAVQDVIFQDRLPQGVRTAEGQRQVSVRIANLAPGESIERNVKLDLEQAASFNLADSASAEGAEVEAGEQQLQVAQPELAVNIEGPNRQRFGQPLVYKVTVKNESDAPAIDAAVEIQKPEIAETFEASGGQVQRDGQTFKLGRLNAGQEKTFELRIEPNEAASLELNAEANAYCVAEPATARVRTEVEGAPAVQVEVVDKQDPVAVGERTQYVITVRNEGSQTDRNLEIQARVPQEFDYVETSGETEVEADGQLINIGPVDSIDPGQSMTWTLTVEAREAGQVRFSARLRSENLTDYVIEQEPTTISQ